jgi:enoyl-CoA hydratase
MIVHSESADGVVTVTLDSPANRNALSRQLVAELSTALDAAAADETAHAVLLTHTGPAFCSGAALDEMLGGATTDGTRDMLALFRKLLTLPVPVVALVDGAARAGGIGVLGSCDVVIASARSTFAFTEVRLGLAPAVISLRGPRHGTSSPAKPSLPTQRRRSDWSVWSGRTPRPYWTAFGGPTGRG